MLEMNKLNKNSINIHFDIDLACNTRCSYCYKLDELDNTKLVNREVLDYTIAAINKLKVEKPNYKINITILGGEPLLVVDEVIEFIKKVYSEGITIQILSNLNFDAKSPNLQKILEFYKKFPNFQIYLSWHKSCDEQQIKQNILLFQDLLVVTFLLENNNLQEIYNDMKWLTENTNIIFGIENIRSKNDESLFDLYDDYRYREIISKSDSTDGVNIIGDTTYSNIESKKLNLLNISKQYYTICQLSEICIDWHGNIQTVCTYPYNGGHIKNGIEIIDVFCNKYSCRCITNTYKKLIKVRND